MGIARVPYSCLIYGTRMTAARERIPWEQPLSGNLYVRVFRVEFSPALWRWMREREQRFQKLRKEDREPTEDDFPELYDFVQHVWFFSPKCSKAPNYDCEMCREHLLPRHLRFIQNPSGYLPPAPRWNLVAPAASDPDQVLLAQ